MRRNVLNLAWALLFVAGGWAGAGADGPSSQGLAEENLQAAPTLPSEANEETKQPRAAEHAYRPPPSPSPKAPVKPWKPRFFNNDFSYQQDPDHRPLLGEEFKDHRLDFVDGLGPFDGSTLSFGGELRYRFMSEDNRLRPGGPGQSTYDLWRWRNYLDFRASDVFRLYVESMDASIFNQDLPATAIDLNRWDIQNAFVDIKTAERDGQPIYFRAGRQELLYGAQRLISPLDWGNTRRNFEGFLLTSKGATWDVDLFTTRPVNTATGNGPLSRFDHERDRADASRTFNGAYATYHGLENSTIDLYWLWLREQEEVAALKDGSRHTVGLRWLAVQTVYDACCDLSQLWKVDLEGAYQFGHDNDLTVQAGFVTADVSVTLPGLPGQPMLKGLYYWGSGDDDPSDGEDNTFSVLFPLGHAYWGLIDNLSGQNLHDYSLQFSVTPAEELTFLAAMHWFDLDQETDVLYNVAGVPLGSPGTGLEVGEELDLVATYALHPNFTIQVGQFWFWNGTFIQNNLPRSTAQQFYVQTTLRY